MAWRHCLVLRNVKAMRSPKNTAPFFKPLSHSTRWKNRLLSSVFWRKATKSSTWLSPLTNTPSKHSPNSTERDSRTLPRKDWAWTRARKRRSAKKLLKKSSNLWRNGLKKRLSRTRLGAVIIAVLARRPPDHVTTNSRLCYAASHCVFFFKSPRGMLFSKVVVLVKPFEF